MLRTALHRRLRRAALRQAAEEGFAEQLKTCQGHLKIRKLRQLLRDSMRSKLSHKQAQHQGQALSQEQAQQAPEAFGQDQAQPQQKGSAAAEPKKGLARPSDTTEEPPLPPPSGPPPEFLTRAPELGQQQACSEASGRA